SPGLPAPCPPQPMTAMPSFSPGARSARTLGTPNTPTPAAAPARAALCLRNRRRVTLALFVMERLLRLVGFAAVVAREGTPGCVPRGDARAREVVALDHGDAVVSTNRRRR